MSNILIVPLSAKITFDNNQAGSNTINPLSAGTSMELLYNGEGGVTFTSKSSASDRFDVEGKNGNLFSVTDILTGSIFTVNDISGLPLIEVISDGTADVVKMGTIGTNAFVLSSDKLGLGTDSPVERLTVAGNISATGSIHAGDGFTGTVASPTSITVVNGIVTAVS